MSKTAMLIISMLLICLLLTSCASSGISANSPDTTDAVEPTTPLEPFDYHDNILHDYTDIYAGDPLRELSSVYSVATDRYERYPYMYFSDESGNPCIVHLDEDYSILEYLVFDKDKMDRSFTGVSQLMNDIYHYSPVSMYEIISLFGVPSAGYGSGVINWKSSGDDGYFFWYTDPDYNITYIDYSSDTITEITEEAFATISLGMSESEVISILGNPQSCYAHREGYYNFTYVLANSEAKNVTFCFQPGSDGILRVYKIIVGEETCIKDEAALNSVSVGMSKTEVINILGRTGYGFTDEKYYLRYTFDRPNGVTADVTIYFQPDSDGILRVSKIKIVD